MIRVKVIALADFPRRLSLTICPLHLLLSRSFAEHQLCPYGARTSPSFVLNRQDASEAQRSAEEEGQEEEGTRFLALFPFPLYQPLVASLIDLS